MSASGLPPPPPATTTVGPLFVPVKITDIGYITAVYFLLGFVVGIALNAPFGKFDPAVADNKPATVLAVELILHFWMIGVVTYGMRNLAEHIPSPLHGVQGLDHRRVKEVGSLATFSMVLMWNQRYMISKMLYLHERISQWMKGKQEKATAAVGNINPF